MPPRKSDAAVSRKSNTGEPTATAASEPQTTAEVSAAETRAETEPADALDKPTSAAGEKDKDKDRRESRGGDAIAIEDLNMPRSIVTRLAKGMLPPNTQLQGSAITAMTKSATVFINHLANAANTLTTNSGKKTIMPADVFAALDDIEFGFMREQLEAEFAKFNHIQTSKRTDYRKRVAAAKKASTGGDDGEDAEVSAMGAGGDESFALPAVGDATAGMADGTARDTQPQAKKVKRAYGAARAVRAKVNGRGGVVDDNATEAEDRDIVMGEVDEDDEAMEQDEEGGGEDEGKEEENEEEEEDEEEEEENEEDEEDEEDEEEDEEREDMEGRDDAPDDDEALDSDSSE